MLSHSWNLSPTEAVALQRELREQVIIQPLEKKIKIVAGTDLSYDKGSDQFYAGIVFLDYESMEVIGHSTVSSRAPFPYIPGLLSFREIPSLMEAWAERPLDADVLMCDGHGIAHPRRLGIATHLGLLTGTPSIGCAKRKLIGEYEEPEKARGQFSLIKDGEETIGYALCTKDKVKPVFVSPGHLISMEQSRAFVLHCARGYKLPEPTRQAHLLVNRLRRGEVEAGVWKAQP